MLKTTLVVLISSIFLHSASMVTVKEHTATTSSQYISKTPSMYNGDVIWRLTPSSGYTASSYYLEVYWMTFTVQGKIPDCQPDYVEVFVKDTTTFRSIGKYCSNNTGGIYMKYMHSIGGEMLIRYKSTQNSNLYLRYRLRSRLTGYMGLYSYAYCYNTYSSSLTGDIYSSGYPRTYTISSSSCYHKIVTSTGKETRIAMMDMSLNCNHGVHIRGSYSSSSTYASSAAIYSFKCSYVATVVTRYTFIHIQFYRAGYTSTNYRGFLLSYIAYDAGAGTPVPPGTCTFESDECGFLQSTTDHFNWIRHKGRTSSNETGPSIDHTSGRSDGHYLYTESSLPRTLGHKSIISKQYTSIATDGSCLKFWYHLYGSSVGKLNVYLKKSLQEAVPSPSWNLIGEQGDRWEMGQLTLTQNLPVVVFEGVIGSSYTGDIAIDDISLTSGKCPSHVPVTGATFTIQHQSGKLCPSWNKINDELVLTNSCNELFMLTETGAILHIPSGKCVAPIAAVNNGVIKLQSACNSANSWFQHTSAKTIRHMRTGFCIHPYLGSSSPTIGTKLVIYVGCIEARLQFNFIYGGSKVTTKEYTATTSSQYISKTPSMYNGDAIWRLAPSSAYTASSYYLEVYWMTFTVQGKMPDCQPDYVEVFVKDTTAFRSIGKYCSSNIAGIRMKYMYSIGGEMLIRYKSTQNSNLYLRYRLRSRLTGYMGFYSYANCYNTYSSSLTGDIYSSGYPRTYTISSSSCYHKIVTSTGKETRIAMMDMSLNCNHGVHIRGSYSSSSTYASSAAIYSFKCSYVATVVTRYTFIHIQFYRAGYTSTNYRGFLLSYIAYDAGAGTPVPPGTCTFESDECGFLQSTTDHFNWIRHKGRTSSNETGPSIDHTSGRSDGHYLYTESSSPRTLGHKSIISKQYTGIATDGSCLKFWYHLYGSSVGKLNVYLKKSLQDALPSPSWNLIGEQGDRWEMGQLTLTQSLPVVVFEGVIGSSYTGDIAIDDISLTSGKCPSHVPVTGATFTIQHQSGKLCPSWNKTNDELVLTNSCDEQFMFTDIGAIFHILSGKCVAPIAAVSNGVIKLQSACNSANSWFQHTSAKTIRHMRTGFCIHPYLGSSSPTIGTKLVIYVGCIEARLQFNFIYGGSKVTTKEYTATTSSQYISKTPSMYNGDAIWRLAPSSAYTASSYYLEVYWMTFTVQGKMPDCQPDYVEVFVKDTTAFRSIGKYCSSNTAGIRMKYMYSIGGEMLIRYKSTQNSNLYLRYRLRSRLTGYMGFYSYANCYNTYSSSLTGDIYSSGYPRTYTISSSSCYHKIVTSTGKETRIAMMDMSLNCNHGVHIRGSYSSSSTYASSAAIYSFKCSYVATVVTRYTFIHIQFYRAGYTSTNYRGFLLSYIAYDAGAVTPVPPGTCTFESDECGFLQSTTDHFNWIRHKGRTSSNETGPSIDHTSGRSDGHYLYTESSLPRTLGHKSIISKQYTGIATDGSCLKFWYHLYGSSVGKLNVYLKKSLQDALPSPSWNLIGEQGDRWEMGQLTLTQNLPVVVFEGVIGSSYTGDIAIDDISLTSGKCSSHVPENGIALAIQHRSGKLCPSWNKSNDELVLTNSCDELFMFTEIGAILHTPSGKCLAPIAAVDNGVIKLQSACNSANAWFQHTSLKTIRHMRTGKCIQPYLGSSSPTIGTKLVIYVGCTGAAKEFDFFDVGIPSIKIPQLPLPTPYTTITSPSVTTYKPTTTTNKPPTTTNKPTTTTSKPPTTTNKPPTTISKPPTTTNKPPTTTSKPPTTTNKPQTSIPDGNRDKQSGSKNDNSLSISVIVISSVVCIVLIALAVYFVTKCKRNRAVKRQSVLGNQNQNIDKAANVFFNGPIQAEVMQSTNDISSVLRKQSLAFPTTFDDPVFKHNTSNIYETSLSGVTKASGTSTGSAKPESIRRHSQDVEDNTFGADLSNDFMPMKPLRSCATDNQKQMYLDLDEIQDHVKEHRLQNEKRKKYSLPSIPKFDGAISREARKGSCPSLTGPFLVANQAAFENIKEKITQDKIEEEYLDPNQIHMPTNEPDRKVSAHDERSLPVSRSYDRHEPLPAIPTLHEEK